MNILYGIIFIILGAFLVFLEVKRLLAIKHNYFGGILLILLYFYLMVNGIIMVIHNTDKFPFSWLPYTILMVVVFIQITRLITRRSMALIKRKK